MHVGKRPCEFCRTSDCHLCPGEIPNAAGKPGSVWKCPCSHQNAKQRGQA
jgi:hypothetical protein